MDLAQALRTGREILRNVFARERLDVEAPPPAPAASRRIPAWRLLLAPEPLPLDPEPEAPPRPVRRRTALFAREVLPEDPPPPPRPPRARWLRWLFVPESLDP